MLASSSGGSTSSESFIIQVLDDTADNPNTIFGTIYDDTIQGTNEDNTFVYEGGSDIILALDGFDSLEIPESAGNFKSGQIDNLLSIFPGSHFTKHGDVVIRAENLESVSFIDSS